MGYLIGEILKIPGLSIYMKLLEKQRDNIKK